MKSNLPFKRAGIGLALTLLLFAQAGCNDHRSTKSAPAADASVVASQDLCDAAPTREPCQSVTGAGRAHRYWLRRSGTASRTVVVDFGGPGLSILGGSFGLSAYHPEDSLANYNLLYVEEPWVVKTLPSTCDSALTDYYKRLRDDAAQLADSAGRLRAACLTDQPGAGWGFGSTEYSDTLREIAKKEHVSLAGFIGYSFGDVRFAYAQKLGFDWAVFMHPYPLGVSSDKIITERVSAVKSLLARAKKLTAKPDGTQQDRSLPVTEFDKLSAQVELSYLDDQSFQQYGRQVADGANPARIGLLSDALWQRYGTEQISPSYLAFLDEVCRATPGWPGVTAITSPADVIAAATAACGTAGALPAQAGQISDIGPISTPICIVTSDSDPIVPARLTDRMLAAHRQWQHVVTASPYHASSDGLTECLHRVAD